MLYEKILVPLDGSNAAEIVIPYAEEIAARLGAEIILVSVSEPTVDERENLYQSYLNTITERVKGELENRGAKKSDKVTTQVLVGKPPDRILRYADEENVSLIAMASSGRSERGPWLLGNIAAKILRATNNPVLLIRAPADETDLQQKILVKKILLPLDGSNVGEAAVPHAEGLARELGAELVLLQVLKPPTLIAEGSTLVSAAVYHEQEEARKSFALEYLDGVESKLKKKGITSLSVVASGSPADKIIEFAESNAVDLIAMSSHGRTGIGRWVFGSVTDKILHAGDTPVLTVKTIRE